MADNSAAETISKFGVGLGVGVALYFLIRNLGFGGGRGETQDEGTSAQPLPSSILPPTPQTLRDAQRLEFVMVSPTSSADKTMAFRGPDEVIYSLEEMITRIKAGGRSDMILKIRGDVITGAVTEAEAAIRRSGIDRWRDDPSQLFPSADVWPWWSRSTTEPAKTVSGNARGQYGRSWRSR